MKKYLFILMTIFGLSIISNSFGVANAQVCKISETNDCVEVFSSYIADGFAVVTLSNDSDHTKANVTVTIEVKYGNSTKSFTGKIMASPGSTELKIPIDTKFNNFPPQSVRVTSISGNKCL